jgi:hypothetical protein
VRPCDDLATQNKHCAYRGFTARSGLLGLVQRQAHKIFVGPVLWSVHSFF